MDVLEKLLVDLHSSVESEDGKIDPVSLIANIEAVALGELEPSDLEYVSSLLFESSSPPCLVQFLSDASRTKDREIIKAKVHGLKFMSVFIKLMGGSVEPFAVKVFQSLLNLFKNEESGETKAALMLPSKNILLRLARVGKICVPIFRYTMSKKSIRVMTEIAHWLWMSKLRIPFLVRKVAF